MTNEYLDIYNELSEIPLESTQKTKQMILRELTMCQKKIEESEKGIKLADEVIASYATRY
jgi:hypothetical protein